MDPDSHCTPHASEHPCQHGSSRAGFPPPGVPGPRGSAQHCLLLQATPARVRGQHLTEQDGAILMEGAALLSDLNSLSLSGWPPPCGTPSPCLLTTSSFTSSKRSSKCLGLAAPCKPVMLRSTGTGRGLGPPVPDVIPGAFRILVSEMLAGPPSTASGSHELPI